MESSGRRRGGGQVVGREELLSGRLLRILVREIDRLEEAVKEYKPKAEMPERAASCEGIGAGAKGRIEAIGQVTRTLEKLLELQRFEALAMRGEDEDGEAARLAAEMMRRLRALDARRERPTLFDAGGAFREAATDVAAGSGGGAAETARCVEATGDDIGGSA